MLNGAVIVESLRPGSVFDDSELTLRRLSRLEVPDSTPEQPSVWTVVEFSSQADPGELAGHFARTLTGPGWYVSFDTDSETFVVFPGKVFRYPKGDERARAEAETYALSAGVPKSQTDW
uniref:hypothetical protein n=1 Tax=Paractinoplanes polyasparticus TaxID=2856853 RepID=UPI001C85384A|nr:hypothetical protein [Actinoplanes polyasparticus]